MADFFVYKLLFRCFCHEHIKRLQNATTKTTSTNCQSKQYKYATFLIKLIAEQTDAERKENNNNFPCIKYDYKCVCVYATFAIYH